MNRKYLYNGLTAFMAGMAFLLASCSSEQTFTELENQNLVSEIQIKVSDPLPLLINTDSLVAIEVLPENATNKNVKWSSADEEIASVDPDGRIHANSFGDVFITVAPEIGYAGIKTIQVQVIDKINPITNITVKDSEGNETLSVYESTSLQLVATYEPEDATYSSLSWESKTPQYATVDQNGLVRGIAKGNATIRVSSRDGSNYHKDVTVEVKPVVPVETITFTDGQGDLARYETAKFNITVGPAGATAQTVRWYSDDTKVISINEETGIYYVKDYGTTTITAKSGDAEAKLQVTVRPGKINDDFSFGATNWRGFGEDFGTAVVKDGKFVVTPGTNSKASIERIYDTDFNVTEYPILAIKRTELATGYSMVLDMWTDNNYGQYRGQTEKFENPQKDGANVYYADLTQKFGSMTLPVNQTATLDVFVYRMQNLEAIENISYEVYWIKTFKSVDELKEYLRINDESATEE